MEAAPDPLIESINQQLVSVRAAIESTAENTDEQAALQAFQQELTDWSSRLAREQRDEAGAGNTQPIAAAGAPQYPPRSAPSAINGHVSATPRRTTPAVAASITPEYPRNLVPSTANVPVRANVAPASIGSTPTIPSSTPASLARTAIIPPTTPAKRQADTDLQALSIKKARRAKHVVRYECAACLDSFTASHIHIIRSCGCRYCHNCLAQMLQIALDGSSIARCCGQNVKAARALANSHQDLYNRYNALCLELDADNPMYCAVKTCAAFLGNYRRLKHNVTCRTCKTQTCTRCRQLVSDHLGPHKVCKEDLEDAEMKKAVDKYKFKRCPKCFVVVEKRSGCNNISCRCGTMFCYRCGDRKQRESDLCTCLRAR